MVALGDSITDGAVTTLDADRRWPDLLARRLQGAPALRHLGVLNKGIGGNRLLHDGNTLPGTDFAGLGPLLGDSALSRFDRDVLAQPGARHVIVLLGINDIGLPGVLSPPEETTGGSARAASTTPSSTSTGPSVTRPSRCGGSRAMTAATTCTPTTRGCRPWPTRSRCGCSPHALEEER